MELLTLPGQCLPLARVLHVSLIMQNYLRKGLYFVHANVLTRYISTTVETDLIFSIFITFIDQTGYSGFIRYYFECVSSPTPAFGKECLQQNFCTS